MAFNFNWSPLIADASFYTRAQELLTNALNKSPKPPIIVDDIVVSELNLGSVPPDLEILEVGDLAEDRFRGIFKMRYSGNAYLTLKTRVQVNPLNTDLSTRPSFASPEPLAAASGLTIPIKITLSHIRLSAFIILVFSKSKGLTLVFRNDPLESMKVSSTFDSIPFVRDFLQKTIEQQLRNLLMEDAPAIIHRLSLKMFVPEYRAQEEAITVAAGNNGQQEEEDAADPFASPPQDPVDLNGNPLGATEISALSLDSTVDAPAVFSQRNLLRLAAMTESHRTLSPFTPVMKDVIFRAWAGNVERGDSGETIVPSSSVLSRTQSMVDDRKAGTVHSFSTASDAGSSAVRPALAHQGSSFSRTSLGIAKPGKPRKKKQRVINLRKQKTSAGDLASISDENLVSETASLTTSDSASAAGSAPVSAPLSAPTLPTPYPASASRYGEDEMVTPPNSPPQKRKSPEKRDLGEIPSRPSDGCNLTPDPDQSVRRPKPRQALFQEPLGMEEQLQQGLSGSGPSIPQRPRPSRYFQSFQFPSDRPGSPFGGPSRASKGVSPDDVLPAPFPYSDSAPGGILEQAWMMKMAGEIARRMQEQKSAQPGSAWDGNVRDDTPPPAYAA